MILNLDQKKKQKTEWKTLFYVFIYWSEPCLFFMEKKPGVRFDLTDKDFGRTTVWNEKKLIILIFFFSVKLYSYTYFCNLEHFGSPQRFLIVECILFSFMWTFNLCLHPLNK